MRIGVMTSGGDCAGLNAALRAIVLSASRDGHQVIGIRRATAGLMARPVLAEILNPDDFDGRLLRQGGTVLETVNHGNPFSYPSESGPIDRSGEVIEGLKSLKLDALIGIGGDGSLKILQRLAEEGGIPLVGIPKTIDNDVPGTEVAIGYATAVTRATDALDHLQPTAASHARVMVLEVMGRDAGHIALNAGIAGGADIILVPEIAYRLTSLAKKIRALEESGRNFALVVVAEAVKTEDGSSVEQVQADGRKTYGGIGHYIAEGINELTDAETRVTVLGHVQRGGMPTARDRLMAQIFGVHAVKLVTAGRFGRMVAWRDRQVIDLPLEAVVGQPHLVDPKGPLVETARALGVSFGDD